ncbi:MAG: hypothetical protein MUE33_00490 [Cytophagaceae bacterium]|jgi:septal ring factor EnvC (AmiA/AmiB activator)|nr:hypothetical protein [Cytophagaceae bacterium]
MSEQKQKNNNLIFVIIILALLAVIGYLIWGNMSKDSTIKENNDSITSLNENLGEVSDSLDAKVKELEEVSLQLTSLQHQYAQMGQSNDSLNQRIASLQNTIAKIKKGNAADLKKLNEEIASYKASIAQMEQEIIQLREENKGLTVANKEKADSIMRLSSTNADLYSKYELASILRAEAVTVTAINDKGKELIADEYRAKNIDKLKVTFKLADNKVAPKDKKVIYLQLIEPSGSPLFDSQLDGGYFKMSDGKETAFTQKQTIDFTNTNQTVSFYYKKAPTYTFKVGTYTVKLFQDGNYIGQGTVTVK